MLYTKAQKAFSHKLSSTIKYGVTFALPWKIPVVLPESIVSSPEHAVADKNAIIRGYTSQMTNTYK